MPHSVACIIAVIITVVIMRNKRVTGSKEMAYQSEGVHGLYPEDPGHDDPTLNKYVYYLCPFCHYIYCNFSLYTGYMIQSL